MDITLVADLWGIFCFSFFNPKGKGSQNRYETTDLGSTKALRDDFSHLLVGRVVDVTLGVHAPALLGGADLVRLSVFHLDRLAPDLLLVPLPCPAIVVNWRGSGKGARNRKEGVR